MLRFRFNVRVLTTVLYASIFDIAASEVLTSFSIVRVDEDLQNVVVYPAGDNRTEVDALQVEAQAP